MAIEQTLALVKPPSNLSDIRLAQGMYLADGLRIVESKAFHLTRQQAEEFYVEHKGKEFFERLTLLMSSDMGWAFLIQGVNAVKRVRRINGATNPLEADPHSIRGHLASKFNPKNRAANFVHGSDSVEAAQREIKIVFGFGE